MKKVPAKSHTALTMSHHFENVDVQSEATHMCSRCPFSSFLQRGKLATTGLRSTIQRVFSAAVPFRVNFHILIIILSMRVQMKTIWHRSAGGYGHAQIL